MVSVGHKEKKCNGTFCKGCGWCLPKVDIGATCGYTKHITTTLMGKDMIRTDGVIVELEEEYW